MIGSPECLYQPPPVDAVSALRATGLSSGLGALEFDHTHINYPHMRGVIYLHNVRKVTITDPVFTENDPGPVFSID